MRALVAGLAMGLALLACKRSPSATDDKPAQRSDAESARLVPWLHAPGQYGYVTREGAPAFAGRYVAARRFYEGRAAIGDADGKAGFLDGDGKVVVPLHYDLVGDFKDGHARVFRFDKPVLGPVQGLVLKAGELTEWSIDRDGHESGQRKTIANVLPDLALAASRPLSKRRWETFPGAGGKLGLREIGTGREVFPAIYGDYRFLEDLDGSGVKFIGARGPNDTPPPGPTWSVYDLSGKVLAQSAFDVGEYASEGSFTIAELMEGGDSIWTAIDGTGRRLVAIPFAAAPFFFHDGIAEVTVADVDPIFVGRDGKLYADLGPIDARHRAVGRRGVPFDAGSH